MNSSATVSMILVRAGYRLYPSDDFPVSWVPPYHIPVLPPSDEDDPQTLCGLGLDGEWDIEPVAPGVVYHLCNDCRKAAGIPDRRYSPPARGLPTAIPLLFIAMPVVGLVYFLIREIMNMDADIADMVIKAVAALSSVGFLVLLFSMRKRPTHRK